MILNFAESVDQEHVIEADWFSIAAPISNFLVVFNSSVNVIIYVILNTEFKNHLLQTLRTMVSKLLCGALCNKGHKDRDKEDNQISNKDKKLGNSMESIALHQIEVL